MPVVSGLVSSRDWIAEAMAVRSREMLSHFEAAVAAPRRPRLVDKAPVQAVVHRSDPAEVEWAVVTRSQADRDLIVISESQVSKLDPSAEGGVGAKMGIDATVACDAPEMRFKRIRVPGEETIDLRQVLVPEGDWRRLAEGA